MNEIKVRAALQDLVWLVQSLEKNIPPEFWPIAELRMRAGILALASNGDSAENTLDKVA